MPFLVTYFGLRSWGRQGEAFGWLGERPAGAKVFQEKIDRADAIFMVFVFSFLTPLALVAAFGLVAFVGAVLAGTLESMYHRPGMPDWISTLVVYLVLAVAAYVFRAMWVPHLQGLASLVARAMIMATR